MTTAPPAVRAPALRFPCGDPPALGEANEVAPGILWLRVPLPTGSTINVWALRDARGWTVVDTGMFCEAALESWERMLSPRGPLGELPVTRVICTHLHADHVGMAGWLCRHFDCDLWMTRAEYLQACVLAARAEHAAGPRELGFYRRAGWDHETLKGYRPMGRNMSPMPEAYRRISDGETIRIGDDDWRVLIGRGHSPEHACLYCPERALLIAGDQVLPAISSNVSVWPMEPHANPMQDWLDSLAHLRREVSDAVLVLPAHDDAFIGLHARLDALAVKRHRALDRLRAALVHGPLRAVDSFEPLFGRSDFATVFVRQLATGEAVAYFNLLLAQGEIGIFEDPSGVAWYVRND